MAKKLTTNETNMDELEEEINGHVNNAIKLFDKEEDSNFRRGDLEYITNHPLYGRTTSEYIELQIGRFQPNLNHNTVSRTYNPITYGFETLKRLETAIHEYLSDLTHRIDLEKKNE